MKTIKRFGWLVLGNLMYAIGVNMFIVPISLYSGGIYGICQLIRTIIGNYINFNGIDIAGILYMIVNIPLLILAAKTIGRKFFATTLLSVIISNLFLTFVTLKEPIITDPLTCCIIGGIISGAGAGIVLRAGACGGGTEIIGMYFVKNNKKLSIGQISLLINIGVYTLCAIMFNIETAIYSIIFSAISSFAVDKFHEQNIKVNALIFTNNYEIASVIGKKLVRGSTSWEGKGDYTGNKKYIISTVISKYEEHELKQIIAEYDNDAFVIFNKNIDTLGYVQKHLDA